jgi:hypothetical protein
LKQPAKVRDLRHDLQICDKQTDFSIVTGKHETILLQYENQ